MVSELGMSRLGPIHLGKPDSPLSQSLLDKVEEATNELINAQLERACAVVTAEQESIGRLVEMLMEPILNDIPYKQGDEVLLFVNGLGGTPLVELYIVYRKAYEIAEKFGVKVVRNLIGPYITSLEMAGTSITMLKMDDDMLKLWDAPVKTPALRWGV